MKTLRIATLLLLLSTLVTPFHHVAHATGTTQVAVTEPIGPDPAIDPGTSPNSRAGVASAILCGIGVGLFLDTKYVGFLGWGLSFCAFMVWDALTTPDYP